MPASCSRLVIRTFVSGVRGIAHEAAPPLGPSSCTFPSRSVSCFLSECSGCTSDLKGGFGQLWPRLPAAPQARLRPVTFLPGPPLPSVTPGAAAHFPSRMRRTAARRCVWWEGTPAPRPQSDPPLSPRGRGSVTGEARAVPDASRCPRGRQPPCVWRPGDTASGSLCCSQRTHPRDQQAGLKAIIPATSGSP